MSFFNTTTEATINVNGTNLNALDIAKICSFGPKVVYFEGKDTFCSTNTVSAIIARYFGKDDAETDKIMDKLWGSGADSTDRAVLRQAATIIQEWATLKLYTCTVKTETSPSIKYVNWTKVQSMLGFEFSSDVMLRLAFVTCKRDELDNEWQFFGSGGRSFADTASIGILHAIQDAVNFEANAEREVREKMAMGYTTLDEIADNGWLKLTRIPLQDQEMLWRLIADCGIVPEPFTIYATGKNTGYGMFSCAKPSEVTERYDANQILTVVPTYRDACAFLRDIDAAWAFQRQRNQLQERIEQMEKDLVEAKSQLAKLA